MGQTIWNVPIHVPYFHCYYLAGPLHPLQLENIFTCLHKGPITLVDRHCLPTKFETIDLGNFWSYQPARPGVAIALDVRKRSHIEIKQEKLLDLFIPVDEQQVVAEQMDFSIGNIKPFDQAPLRQAQGNAFGKAQGPQGTPQLSDKDKLQQYEQVLVLAIEREFPISNHTRRQLKRLQQELELTDEDTDLIEACLTLSENLEPNQDQQTKDKFLGRFIGTVKNLFINKLEDEQ